MRIKKDRAEKAGNIDHGMQNICQKGYEIMMPHNNDAYEQKFAC